MDGIVSFEFIGSPDLWRELTTSVDYVTHIPEGTSFQVWDTDIVKDEKSNLGPNFGCFVDELSIGRISAWCDTISNWRL